ncbi:D-alanyl-D-alanine carboxypeptidase family protein [Streptomyces sp. NPDC088551]|uniref:D-alanyl-D-alanine carboxypeptidase family protein n=1 Tax=Streptomyces sp. NPDC088551 TaxID=3365863 RepID=UPI00382B4191
MRHEGDTVAGESPGKSDQRKSSGETAPGERDPRLAVFREPATGAADAAGRAERDDSGSAVSTKVAIANRTEESTESEAAEDARESDGGRIAPAPQPRKAEPAKAEGGSGSGSGSERDAEGEAESADAGSGASKGDGPGKPASADAGADTSADADAGADVDTDTEPDTGTDAPKADKADKADKGGQSGASGEPVKGGKGGTVPSWATPAEEDVTTDTKADAKDGAKKAPEAGSKDSGTGSGTDRPSADSEPVDQPTAVFRALPRPAVDQPTTTLTVPGKREEKARAEAEEKAKAAEKAADGKPAEKPAEKAESAAERTSTFVPLRRDDTPPAAATPPRSSYPSPSPAAPTALPEAAERTRQQPMPPMPPLDLLAELTNKPAPPETPVRTAVRRVKIYTPFALLLLVVLGVVQAVRPLPAPTLALSADPTFTFEGGKLDMPWPGEGQGGVEVEGVGTIGMYGEQKPAPIASVAKVMTAYVILRDHPIKGEQVGPEIEVDKKAGEEANRPDESTAPIKEGQRYTQKQMLQLLMIPSGNNAARLLARWDAKSEPAFVEKMNAAAKDLGMTNTTYTDPSGLESTTVSTAADQMKLGKAVMQNDVFREIVNLPQVRIPGIDNLIINNNSILLEPGVSGIKTGSSTPAGGNLLWAADTIVDGQNRRIIGTVMGAQEGVKLWDKLELSIQNSLKLIKAAQDGVTSATVVKKGDVVGYVDDGLGGRTPVVSTKDLKAVGWAGLQVKLHLGAGKETVPHTAASGTVVGEVTVGTGAGKVSAPVALQGELAEPGFGAKLTRVG